MAATSSTGLIWNASISKNVQNILIYMYANFGAFRTIQYEGEDVKGMIRRG